jgi:hypothetical protein
MVDDNTGVVNDVPVPAKFPPVNESYQFTVPVEAIAPKLTVPVPHTDPGVVPVIVGMVDTITTLLQIELHETMGLGRSVISNVRENETPQLDPAVNETVCEVVLPMMDAFPVTDQR